MYPIGIGEGGGCSQRLILKESKTRPTRSNKTNYSELREGQFAEALYFLQGNSPNGKTEESKEGVSVEAKHRDRRGWRLFTEDEIDRLKAEANQINRTNQFRTTRGLT